jgi:hypothetical protein
MMWQDIALLIFNIMFIAVLIPQIIHMRKTGQWMAVWMCCPTTVGLAGCSIVYFTLGLPLSATMNVIATIIWIALSVISIKNGKPSR